MKPTTKSQMTALEAALAFAEEQPQNPRVKSTAAVSLVKYMLYHETIWETAIRILAAKVREDAAKRLILSDKISQMPPEFVQIIDDNFWELIAHER